jgi:hypothetical protein
MNFGGMLNVGSKIGSIVGSIKGVCDSKISQPLSQGTQMLNNLQAKQSAIENMQIDTSALEQQVNLDPGSIDPNSFNIDDYNPTANIDLESLNPVKGLESMFDGI